MHTEDESLIAQAKKKIESIKQETEIQIQKKKTKLDQDLIQKRLAELNIHESEQIALINRRIIEQKNRCVEMFTESLKGEIRRRIRANPKGYFQYIQQKILNLQPLLQTPVTLQLNASDLDQLHKNPSYNPIPVQLEKIMTIDSNPVDIFLGFLIFAVDHSFSIDESWEMLIQKRKWELSKIFMKIFPLFEVNVKNALELDREYHGDAPRYDSE